MFERFTDRARRVVVLAQDEARTLNHDYIGTEHMLLALIAEGEGIAAKTLDSAGVVSTDVRAKIAEIIGLGQQSPSGHIPFTPRSKRVLELGLRSALRLGHNYIGTEHLLLGLIDEGDGVGIKILAELGVDPSKLRAAVIMQIGQYTGKPVDPMWSKHVVAQELWAIKCSYCFWKVGSSYSPEDAVLTAKDAGARLVNDSNVACPACLKRPLEDFLTAASSAASTPGGVVSQ